MRHPLWSYLTVASVSFAYLIGTTGPTRSCGTCEYSDSFGVCWAYLQCIPEKWGDAAQGVLDLGAALASHDMAKIKQSLGTILTNTQMCGLPCESVAHTLLPNLSESQIHQAVGAPPPPTAQGSGELFLYQAHPDCLSISNNGVVYAGWKNPPVLIDDIPGAGAAHTFQDVQLSPHTIIHATAPICPGWKNSVTEALFLYNQNYHVQLTGANLPTVVKWFIYGPVDQ